MESPNLDVTMIRQNLRDLPEYPLPEGFRIRTYVPGDEKSWVWIHELADEYNKVTTETFLENFGYDLAGMSSRGFFLDSPDGRTIGTATAWYSRTFEGQDAGRVHWVAMIPEFQGQGLSKPLLAAVLRRLAENHDRAYLTTSTARIPAIHLYLQFGFQPYLKGEGCRAAWEAVREQLSHPLLDSPVSR